MVKSLAGFHRGGCGLEFTIYFILLETDILVKLIFEVKRGRIGNSCMPS
jgi:hypothetical protein